MAPHVKAPLPIQQRIIPTPRQFEKINEIHYFHRHRHGFDLPVILLPANAAPAEKSAAGILQERLLRIFNSIGPESKYDKSMIPIIEGDIHTLTPNPKRLIFNIGRTNLHRKINEDSGSTALLGKKQGYMIKCIQSNYGYIVLLSSPTPIGHYYAATTAIQMLQDDAFIYHNATVVDYPDFAGRSYLLKKWHSEKDAHRALNGIMRMSRNKLNTVYIGYGQTGKQRWFDPEPHYIKGVKAVGKICQKSGVMNLAVMVNPYYHLGFEASIEDLDEKTIHTWTHSNPVHIQQLKNLFKIGLDAGAKTIMLATDDFVPHQGHNPKRYSLYAESDKKRFINLQNAHAHVISTLYRWVKRRYPGTRFEYTPPWYSNEHINRSAGQAEIYFNELIPQIPNDIAILWTGPTIRSLSIDMADLFRFKTLIQRWPMLWDNTLYARSLETNRYGGYATYYPEKARMCNLFEPYDTYKPKRFYLYSNGGHLYVNGYADSEIEKIKFATVADYEWYTAAYHPEKSLWKAMVRSFGEHVSRLLLYFNDAYYGLYSICMRMEFYDTNSEYLKEGVEAGIVRGRFYLKQLNQRLDDIVAALPSGHLLIDELERLRNRQKRRFVRLIQNYHGINKVKE
jgi:hypothetical protein